MTSCEQGLITNRNNYVTSADFGKPTKLSQVASILSNNDFKY